MIFSEFQDYWGQGSRSAFLLERLAEGLLDLFMQQGFQQLTELNHLVTSQLIYGLLFF